MPGAPGGLVLGGPVDTAVATDNNVLRDTLQSIVCVARLRSSPPAGTFPRRPLELAHAENRQGRHGYRGR
jgi:hypothetical protein